MDFHGRAPAADEFERWLDEVFEITTPEADFHRYVGNRQSGTLHIRGANHLPGAADREPFHRVADALGRGYDRCGVCFVPTPTVSDYDTERSLALFGLQHVRATYYPHVDADLQAGILGAIAGGTDNAADDIIAGLTAFTAQLFLAGHGRDREREADLFASFYLNEADIGDRPLVSSFRKLKFARDAYDPFGGGGGLFASHPHIEERLEKARGTRTAAFADDEVFHGVRRNGALVATLRFDVQRLFRNEPDVIATLSTTAELGDDDNVNTLDIRVDGRRIRLRERTAERIFPSDEVSAVFGNDETRDLIDSPIETVELDLRNVDRWVRFTDGGAP